jgi:predicted RNase H-like nuclease (RuvC/YqgF family)
MTTNYDDDFDEDFEPQDVVKQLRKVNRTLEKRLKELEDEATTLKTQTRQRTVKDVLTAKGINPKVAAFIPQDIDISEEAVTNWLNEYGDVFGVNQEATQGESQSQNPALQAQKRINEVVSTGTPPGVDEDAMSKILNAKSASELSALLGVSVQ